MKSTDSEAPEADRDSLIKRKDPNGYDPELGARVAPIMKVLYCGIEERLQFIRRVYTILSAQLLLTLGVVLLCTLHESVRAFVRANTSLLIVTVVFSFVFLILLICVPSLRRTAPINLILLGGFTLCEGYLLGVISAMYTTSSVIQALIIVTFITVGLTIFTFQSNYDFSKLGVPLFVLLMVFVLGGFLRLFLPSTPFLDTVWAVLGALLFSLYIVFDTFMVIAKLNTDEYILGALDIYLDVVNLFIYILQIFGTRD